MAPNRPTRALTLPAHKVSVSQIGDKEMARRVKSVGASSHLVEINSRVEQLLDTAREIETGRISVLGKARTGKSALVRLLAFGQYLTDYKPTISEATIPMFALLRIDASSGHAKQPLSNRISRRLTVKLSKKSSAHADTEKKKAFETSDFDAVIASGSRQLGTTIDFLESSPNNLGLIQSMKMTLTDCVADFKLRSPVAYKACIANSYGFLLVVSVDDPASLKVVQAAHADIVHDQVTLKRPTILVVNKCDIPDAERKVEWSEIKDLAKSLNVPRVDVSCKTGYGMDQILVHLAALSSQFNSSRAEFQEDEVGDDYIFVSENERKMKAFQDRCIIA